MIREARAPDGRIWTVRREINWSRPPKVQEFEHDVAVGQVAGIVMLGLIALMLLTIVFWTPPGVVIPYWLILAFIALLLVVPLHWALSRPWTIVAATHQPIETGGEEWEGTVRGVLGSRREVAQVARNIEEYAVPGDGRGPVQANYPSPG